MKITLAIMLSLFITLSYGCKSETNQPENSSSKEISKFQQPGPETPPELEGGFSGSVVETMNTAGYTYVQIDTGSEKIWAAAPETILNPGDKVTIPPGMPMYNYHSNTLERDFEVVYFVREIIPEGMTGNVPPPSMMSSSTETMPKADKPPVVIPTLEKAAGGHSIAEVWQNKDTLAGKNIQVRGVVVKFNPQVMGRNWLHIQDGSGDAASGTNDLTVTTDTEVNFGDTVLVNGTLAIDKDFGFSYQYAAMLEEAKITIEQKAAE